MKSKVIFIFTTLTLLYVVIAVKAFYIQVINKEKLIAYSESQTVRETKVYPKRGYILDRNENPLAINIQQYSLFTFVKDEKNLAIELKKLKAILPRLNTVKILKDAKKRKKFTWIARKINLKKETVEKLKDFNSIFYEVNSSRLYPNHSLMSQIIGFVGIDNHGLSGVEYLFDKELQGEPEMRKYIRDAKGRPIKYKSAKIETKAEDITLSLDKDIQAVLEENLKAGVEKFEATMGGAAVMDAFTGEILAMANYPTFDPNVSTSGKKTKLSYITDPFEPGSIFKTLTIASALENNLITEETSYYCERGKYKVGNHYISESDNKHTYEWLTVNDILKYSSNIGTTKIAFDLTYPALKKTLDKFNIGNKTDIEFPGESRGISDKEKNVTPLRLSNISFGQGIATTGVQMLAAYSVFANGGYYVKPTLLKVRDIEKVEKKRIISEKTAKRITKMLVAAVEEGTGENAKVKHFTIAGKTSTAQKPSPSGGYEGYISGFIGYPVNVKNRFVVFVYIDNPQKGGYYGSVVAAPIFKNITKNILFKNKSINQIANTENVKSNTLDHLHIKYSGNRKFETGIMPNLIGLDKSSISNTLRRLEVDYDQRGFGIAVEQFPSAGTRLLPGSKVKIRFSPPKYD